ncbi:MAG: 30S ribosomal protein S5 [Candidatus Aureabacteria bacterium]|nr:30S ribosomal protein S5 [Candidatus Auribacterota bacterium]
MAEVKFAEAPEFAEKVVTIDRCAKVVKGGRRFSFRALVVNGDGRGHIGYGLGKANEIADAIRKASDAARRQSIFVEKRGVTIPHETIGIYGAAKVLLKPAAPGTGIIAGGGVRIVLDMAGVKDVLAKSLKSNNPINVVKATFDALKRLRTKEQVMRARGID